MRAAPAPLWRIEFTNGELFRRNCVWLLECKHNHVFTANKEKMTIEGSEGVYQCCSDSGIGTLKPTGTTMELL